MIKYEKRQAGRPKQPRKLTGIQKEIVILSAQGYSAKEIAVKQNKSHLTIGGHFSYLLNRWGVYSRLSLLVVLIQKGFIKPEEIELRKKAIINN